MDLKAEYADDDSISAPPVMVDLPLPKDGFKAHKHQTLARLAKEIQSVEKKAIESEAANKREWNTMYKPMLEFQIEEMERRSFELYQRLETEAGVGMEHNIMLTEEHAAHKEAIDDVSRRVHCPDG